MKCTTTINSSSTQHPELCDKDKDVLNAQEEEYRALVEDFANDGWDVTVECIRQ